MQNIPRIFLEQNLETQKNVPVDKDVVHYLRRVMRTDRCLVFNNGTEYKAHLSNDNTYIIIDDKTEHVDPSNNLTLCFAPIKRLDDLLNMATQMGIKCFQPVITARTVVGHINWGRMKKIIIEAAEQSGRNSVPELLEPVKFTDLDLTNIIVADERVAHGVDIKDSFNEKSKILIGPEGGFSPDEFAKMDKFGVEKISLGKTILRAEVAAVVAIAKVLNNENKNI